MKTSYSTAEKFSHIRYGKHLYSTPEICLSEYFFLKIDAVPRPTLANYVASPLSFSCLLARSLNNSIHPTVLWPDLDDGPGQNRMIVNYRLEKIALITTAIL